MSGVTLVLDIGRTPHNPTFGTIVTVTIANRSTGQLEWWADGCGGNAVVSASTRASWRDSAAPVAAKVARYREWLRRDVPAGPVGLQLDRLWTRLRRDGGCNQFASRHVVRPGGTVRREYTWEGSSAGRLGPPPNGPLTFTARFERLASSGEAELEPIELSLDSWLIGGPPEEFLSPYEAIDIALADDRLAAWLAGRPIGSTDRPVVEFDRDLWIWVVGVRYGEPLEPLLHAAYIDPMTHDVFAVKEHRVAF